MVAAVALMFVTLTAEITGADSGVEKTKLPDVAWAPVDELEETTS
jgi:hypothetical protein